MRKPSRQFSVTLYPALDEAVEAYAKLHTMPKARVITEALAVYKPLDPFRP